jgi:hypothetical protein
MRFALILLALFLSAPLHARENQPPVQTGCHWGKKCAGWAVVCTYWEPYGTPQPSPNSPACKEKKRSCIATIRTEICGNEADGDGPAE